MVSSAHDRPRRRAARARGCTRCRSASSGSSTACSTARSASAARRAPARRSCAATARVWTTDKDGIVAGAARGGDHRAHGPRSGRALPRADARARRAGRPTASRRRRRPSRRSGSPKLSPRAGRSDASWPARRSSSVLDRAPGQRRADRRHQGRSPRTAGSRRGRPGTEDIYKIYARAFAAPITCRQSWTKRRPWSIARSRAPAGTGKGPDGHAMNASDSSTPPGRCVAGDRGLLAMDESNPTADKRFDALGIAQTRGDAARLPRHDLHRAGWPSPSAARSSTTRRSARALSPRAVRRALEHAGIVPGIKVDIGAQAAGRCIDGELVTEGLDGLRERLGEYVEMGARFAKWRAVITIGDGMPEPRPASTPTRTRSRATRRCARRPGWCPSSSPRSSWTARTRWRAAAEVTERSAERRVRPAAHAAGAARRDDPQAEHGGAGPECPTQDSVGRGGRRHRRVLAARRAGGGWRASCSSRAASRRRARRGSNAMHVALHGSQLPWPLAFSFARAIQDPAMKAWAARRITCRGAAGAGRSRRCNAQRVAASTAPPPMRR